MTRRYQQRRLNVEPCVQGPTPLCPLLFRQVIFLVDLPRRYDGGPRSWIIVTIPEHDNLASFCFSLQTESTRRVDDKLAIV